MGRISNVKLVKLVMLGTVSKKKKTRLGLQCQTPALSKV